MARIRNPIDDAAREELALRRLLWARVGFFNRIRLIPAETIMAAIRQRSIAPIVNSFVWQSARAWILGEVNDIELKIYRRGIKGGIAEVPNSKLGPEIAALAEELGAPAAVDLVQSVDARTRQGISQSIKSASGKYARSPSMAHLRGLAGDVKQVIGLTPKQAARIARKREALRKAGKSESLIDILIREDTERTIALRAQQIADRGVVEAIGEARHKAWLKARDAGEIPGNSMKVWQDQGDKAVRPTHRAQTQVGPIPLDAIYEFHGVLHPPSPDFGCRCWERLFIPPR